ncbi:MAG: hypothetical protein ACOC9H_01110 [Gemmatimonadota bacterium]
MATTKNVTRSAANAADGSAIDELATSLNDLIDRVEGLTAKLDADGGVTDEDYESTFGDATKINLTP